VFARGDISGHDDERITLGKIRTPPATQTQNID
jgi:hypothetical protein